MRPNLPHGAPGRVHRGSHRGTAVALSALIFVAIAIAIAAPLSSVQAAPSLADKQAQARRLGDEVNRLDQRYDDLNERYRGAQYELDRVRRDVDQAHRVVVATREHLGVARNRLATRAVVIYQRGGSGADVNELLESQSVTNFFARIDALSRVSGQDTRIVDHVETLDAQVRRKEAVLRTAKVRAARAERKLRRARNAMQSLRDARQAKLDSVNADIRRIMEAQQRAAQARAAAEARRSASLASKRVGGEATNDATGSDGVSTSTGANAGSSGTSGSSDIAAPAPPASGVAASAASIAMGKLGSPYVWGAAGPDSFDCSGLVVWAFAQAGRSGLPHSTYSLVNMGVSVPIDQLQVGDLIFSSGIGHVGIYVGNGSFVHAPHSGDVVKVTRLADYGDMSVARRL